MSGRWHYVHGYGFAHGSRALNLSGDGPISEDKSYTLAALNSIDILTAERDAARAVLRELEWEGCDEHGDPQCLICCSPWLKKDGAHAPDCDLKAALGEA